MSYGILKENTGCQSSFLSSRSNGICVDGISLGKRREKEHEYFAVLQDKLL